MAERALPGIGLIGYADHLADNWDAWMNTNLRTISAVLGGAVLSASTALPGSPTDGDIYIVPTGAPSHANDVAIRDAGAWVYLTPQEGWRFYVKDTDQTAIFDGTIWTTIIRQDNVILRPAASVTPASNGDLVFELTSNTSLTIKVKGSDGTVRSAILTLS